MSIKLIPVDEPRRVGDFQITEERKKHGQRRPLAERGKRWWRLQMPSGTVSVLDDEQVLDLADLSSMIADKIEGER